MCTCILYGSFFGRTLDLDRSLGEEVVILPRRYPIDLLYAKRPEEHPAIIGCALVKDGVPLWFDAMNEYGLGAAGLNFPDHAAYLPPRAEKNNLASYELIPYILSKCKNVSDAVSVLEKCNITPDAVSTDLPPTPMHWMIADKERSIAVEPHSDGLRIYENSFGVLTNSPPFPVHRDNIMHTPPSEDRLPGDWSSESRFIRAFFAKKHTAGGGVNDYFHIMDTVAVPNGCSKKDWHTVYTSSADLERGDYYFTTYEDRRIRKVSLADAELDSDEIFRFSMRGEEDLEILSRCVDKTQQM